MKNALRLYELSDNYLSALDHLTDALRDLLGALGVDVRAKDVDELVLARSAQRGRLDRARGACG